MSEYNIFVVGGGLGGISAGALFARPDRRVQVLHQSWQVGKCCSNFEKDCFDLDVDASIVEIIKPVDNPIELV